MLIVYIKPEDIENALILSYDKNGKILASLDKTMEYTLAFLVTEKIKIITLNPIYNNQFNLVVLSQKKEG